MLAIGLVTVIATAPAHAAVVEVLTPVASSKQSPLRLAQQSSTGSNYRTCPPGTYGRYPNCKKRKKKCPPGTFGKHPICIKIAKPKCPPGTYGKWPKCKKPKGEARPKRKCPSGTYGTPPYCKERVRPKRPKKPKKDIVKKRPKKKVKPQRKARKKLKRRNRRVERRRPRKRARRRLPRVPEVLRDQRPDEVVVMLDLTQGANLPFTIAQKYKLVRLEGETNTLLKTRLQRYRIPDRRSVEDVIAAMSADKDIRAVQPNFLYRLAGKKKRKRVGRGNKMKLQYALGKLQLQRAHGVATGSSVLVAVIDSAIDTSHPEFRTDAGSAISITYDATRRPAGKPDAHGTAVAGIIAAQQDMRGTAPGANVLAVRAFFKEKKSKPLTTTYVLLRAFDFAHKKKSGVLNLSFSGPEDAALEEIIDAADKTGMVLVAAAGNNGPKAAFAYPAAYRQVIAVTAIDKRDKLYKKANRGDYVALSAPGVNVLAPVPRGGYDFKSGTSFAAPHVSGLVALMLERNPNLTSEQIREILIAFADDLGPKGRDPLFGAGRVDAFETLNAVITNRLSRTPDSDGAPKQVSTDAH